MVAAKRRIDDIKIKEEFWQEWGGELVIFGRISDKPEILEKRFSNPIWLLYSKDDF
jgi:hypothetical protein